MSDLNRIAAYLPSLDGGGAQRVVLTLVNTMAEKGVNVDLVLVRAEGPFMDEVHPGIRVVNLGASHVALSLSALARYLRRERPVALLSSLNYVNIVALAARPIAGVNTRIVVSEHNTLSQTRPRNLRDRMLPRLMRMMYPKADLIVAVSHGVADDLSRTIGLDRARIRVIYNPVVRPDIFLEATKPLSHPWFQEGAPPVVLGVGRLTEQKDFANLIHACAKLREHRDVRLMILGEGECRSQLEALVEDLDLSASVSLPGFVNNPFAYLARASVFALSSRWEGLPTVLIEAMACGTPVVATDCPSGPWEILDGGNWGRLVPIEDAAALAKAIAETMDAKSSPDVAQRAGAFTSDSATMSYLDALL